MVGWIKRQPGLLFVLNDELLTKWVKLLALIVLFKCIKWDGGGGVWVAFELLFVLNGLTWINEVEEDDEDEDELVSSDLLIEVTAEQEELVVVVVATLFKFVDGVVDIEFELEFRRDELANTFEFVAAVTLLIGVCRINTGVVVLLLIGVVGVYLFVFSWTRLFNGDWCGCCCWCCWCCKWEVDGVNVGVVGAVEFCRIFLFPLWL